LKTHCGRGKSRALPGRGHHRVEREAAHEVCEVVTGGSGAAAQRGDHRRERAPVARHYSGGWALATNFPVARARWSQAFLKTSRRQTAAEMRRRYAAQLVACAPIGAGAVLTRAGDAGSQICCVVGDKLETLRLVDGWTSRDVVW